MIAIKSAGLNELEIIHQLAHDTWPSAYSDILGEAQLLYMLDKIYSLASLQKQLSVLKHEFIIILKNESPVGFASFSPHENNERIYHLNKIYVLPRQQGKNIGRQMLDHIITQIKTSGVTSLQLNVNRNNKAIDFYKKQGFEIIREEDIDIGEGYFMNDYVMEKKI